MSSDKGPQPPSLRKGRGALSNPEGRFEPHQRETVQDGWDSLEAPPQSVQTVVKPEAAKSILTHNSSPDVPFERSINPYRGCEHGCIYCYARPAHAYMNLSPGLDFETRLFYKPDARALLEAELRKPSYVCKPIALGANTDPYQPIEREYGLMRQLLELLQRCRHPVMITTKGAALMERDLDLLSEMARDDLVQVALSITTLDADLKRNLEPRAAGAATRLRLIRMLADRGIPVTVMVAPVIPFVNDAEIERILEAGAAAGARDAHYVLLRLPHEVKELFREWLGVHYPHRAEHVMSLVQQMRGGKDYDARFGVRQIGEGEYARLIAQRFALARQRFGLVPRQPLKLNTALFRPPVEEKGQMGFGF